MAELPEDLIISDILPRLPLKSIAQFRQVSKLWRSWLSNPRFVEACIHDSLESIIIEQGNDGDIISFYTPTTATTSCIIRDSNNLLMKKLKYLLPEKHIITSVDGSCRGLVLLSHYNKSFDRSSKVLMNPVTWEAEEVVNYPSSKLAELCGLGYDSLNEDYKIVTLTYQSASSTGSFVDVYSVKAKTWNRVADSKYNFLNPDVGHGLQDDPGVFVNGCIHWKVYEPDNAIASFSLAREQFEILHPPSELDQDEFVAANLTVLGGCLSIEVQKYNSKSFDVWVMEEFGVQGSWRKITINYPRRPEDGEYDVVCHLGDDEILVLYNRKQLMVYNCRNRDWKDVGVVGIPPQTTIGSCTLFTRTLVSLSYNRLEAHKNTS